MPQLDLFSIKPSIASYAVALTPAIEEALAAHSPVVVGISGGKDSSAVAIRTFEHLDHIGHCGPRLLVHCDLGEIEWAESLRVCRRLADLLRIEFLVLQRKGRRIDNRLASAMGKQQGAIPASVLRSFDYAEECRGDPLLHFGTENSDCLSGVGRTFPRRDYFVREWYPAS